MNLYLLQYNGYYNRLVKREEGISAYLPYVIYGPDINDEYLLTDIDNFYEADGIDTKQTVNTPNADFDYLVALDEYGNIHSRWFVIQAMKLTNGQYELSLHRDLLADYYDEIIAAPSYIERAMVNYGNKLIFNSENSSVNQIKKKEVLLKDESGCGWLVGYIADNTPETTIITSSQARAFPNSPIALSTIKSLSKGYYINDFYYNYYGTGGGSDGANIWSFVYNGTGNLIQEFNVPKADLNAGTNNLTFGTLDGPNGKDFYTAKSALETATKAEIKNLDAAAKTWTLAKNTTQNCSVDTFRTLQGMQGNIYSSEGSAFKINITMQDASNTRYDIRSDAGSLYEQMNTIFTDTADVGVNSGFANAEVASGFALNTLLQNFTISISYESTVSTASVVIKQEANRLKDAPYKMFAIPYGDIYVMAADGQAFRTSRSITQNVALTLATALGGTGTSYLYDLQLLPFCPMRNALDSGVINLQGLFENIDYTIIPPVAESPTFADNLGIILWPTSSNFSAFIDYEIDVPSTALEFKIENETNFVRLCSPNYSGSFEFRPTENYGIKGFEVNCTYKPYQPYIHINPSFNSEGLYGGDFNDQRGLVCTGDFSLPIADEAWTDYQIQNKSYEDAHKRQVENMRTTYNIQREQQQEAAKINAVTAGISGMASGAMVGGAINPAAAVAGLPLGIAAGLLSNYGAQKDLEYADRLQAEAKSYVEDQYQLSLQNIQALPYSLGKVSAFTINNKIFPFLEFYSCSDEEKEAMRNRIKYTSMTVGAIGTIKEYLQAEPAFIQAQLIRLESIPSDYHLITAIAAELHKGIYI